MTKLFRKTGTGSIYAPDNVTGVHRVFTADGVPFVPASSEEQAALLKHLESSEHVKISPENRAIVESMAQEKYQITLSTIAAIQKEICAPDEQQAVEEQPTKVGGGIKHDGGKPGLALLSREALEQTASVMDFGAKKYTAHNWRKGLAWSRCLSAALRHINAFNDGEDKDPESGLSHMAHAACCVQFLLEFEKTHPELDDRYKKETK